MRHTARPKNRGANAGSGCRAARVHVPWAGVAELCFVRTLRTTCVHDPHLFELLTAASLRFVHQHGASKRDKDGSSCFMSLPRASGTCLFAYTIRLLLETRPEERPVPCSVRRPTRLARFRFAESLHDFTNALATLPRGILVSLDNALSRFVASTRHFASVELLRVPNNSITNEANRYMHWPERERHDRLTNRCAAKRGGGIVPLPNG